MVSISINKDQRNSKHWIWLTLFFFILIPPFLVEAVESGLDPSWRISVNMAAARDFVFGTDYIFTFGPLGFLITKNAAFANKWLILLFEIGLIACTLYAIHFFLKSLRYAFQYCFAVFMILFLISSTNCEILLLFVYIFFTLLFLHTRLWYALLPPVLLAAIGFYIKVNYGIILSVLLYSTLILALYKKICSVRIALCMAVCHLSIIFGLASLLEVDIANYLLSSLHIINAYNDAMFLPINFFSLLPVVALLLVVLFSLIFLLRFRYFSQGILHLYSYGFCALFFYIMFKNGFVRVSPGHINVFFANSTILFGVLYIFSRTESNKIMEMIVGAVLMISYSILILNPFSDHETAFTKEAVVSKLSVGEYIKDIVTDISYKQKLADTMRSLRKVPTVYVKAIGNASVDIIPSEISEIYYYGLNYTPRPVPQSYCAFDEYLDTKNAAKLMSVSGPEFILYDNESLDNRHPFWDESITKRALLTHYDLHIRDTSMKTLTAFNEAFYISKYPDIKKAIADGIFSSGYDHYLKFGREESREPFPPGVNSYLLFKKREKPLQIFTVEETTQPMEIGKERVINRTNAFQYLYANIQYSFWGKLQRFLFQPPEIKVTLKYEDGTKQTYRAIVPIMKTGVLINKKTDTRNDATIFFLSDGQKNLNVTSIQFDASSGFEKQIQTTIKEICFK